MRRHHFHHLPLAAAVVLVLAASLAARTAAGSEKPGSPTHGGSDFLSTDFAACHHALPPNPMPVPLERADFQRTLHGVWVGTRILEEGSAPLADFALVVDTRAREGMAYEDRGPDIRENAFYSHFPAPAAGAPTLTYFYCGGDLYGPFKDVFVKVSDDPAQGMAALQAITGVTARSLSVGDTWSAMIEQDYFTQPRGTSFLNSAYYTVTLEAKSVGTTSGVRWDMVGQYRGSPERFLNGQPVMGLEGGFFEGSRRLIRGPQDGEIPEDSGIGSDVLVACTGNAMLRYDTTLPIPTLSYTKIVLTPIQH